MSKKCKYEPNVRRFVGEYTGFIKGFTVNSGPSCKFENINLNSLGAALRKADRKTIETNALSPAPREPFNSTKFDSGMSTVSPVSQQNYLRQHTSCKCEGLTIAITGGGVHTDNSRDSTPSFSGSSISSRRQHLTVLADNTPSISSRNVDALMQEVTLACIVTKVSLIDIRKDW